MKNKIINKYEMRSIFKRLYIISLIMIGFIVLLSSIFVVEKIKEQQYLGQLINDSGKQRMLSQRIIKSSYGLELSKSETQTSRYYKEIQLSAKLIRTTQEKLNGNELVISFKGNNTHSLLELMNPYFEEMMQYTDRVLSKNEKLSLTDANMLELSSEYYLKYMDELVNRMSIYSTEQSNSISRLIFFLLGIIFFLLIGIYYFVFKPVEQRIASAIEETKNMFDIAPTAIIIMDPKDFSIQEINDAGEALLQINYEEALRMNLQDFISDETSKQIQHFSEKEYERILKGTEVNIKDLKRNEIVCLMSIGKFNFGGKEHLLIGLADITSQKETEEVFEKLATIDEMTGLYNRRTGLAMIGKEFEKAKRHIYDVTICFIDMDGLKHVNDTFGHSEGDWYIRAITTVIKEGIRQGDIGMRFGGDEIVLGLINCDEAEAIQIMGRIQKVLDLIIAKEKKPYDMGISYGFSEYKKDVPISVEAFINFADERMYEVKTRKKTTRA